MIPKTYIDYYGDAVRWFVGKVVDLQDPKELGRIRVRAIGVYDEIDDGDLPWAQTVTPITQGGTYGMGNNLGIQVGANVFGFFLDGTNSQLPLVVGSIPKMEDDIPSTALRARGEGDGYQVDSKIDVPSDAFAPQYPFNKVYETESGHYREVDDTEGAERLKEYHKSGTFYQVQPDGTIVTHIVKDNYTVIAGEDKLHVKGNVTVFVDNDANIDVGGDVNVKVGGSMTADVTKSATVTAKIKATVESALIELKGKVIKLNA